MISRTPSPSGGVPSTEELEAAFLSYLEEMDRCLVGHSYWALVHLLVVLPDVCAALEAGDGETNGTRYQDWCRRYLPSKFRSPEDRWDIRCKVLHQGRALPTRGAHRSYSFVLPGQPISIHDVVITGDQNIAVDIGELADEIKRGIHSWFADLQRSENSARARNVARHASSLARLKRKAHPMIAGIDFQVWSSTST